MENKLDLIAFGTFGIPNGFRQTLFSGNKVNIGQVKSFDLNTNAIKLFPDTKIYSIRKENVNGHQSIAYAIYSFAREKNSDRGGTFIGCSIVFYDKIANETLIKSCLDEFHEELISNKYNVSDNVIQVNHSDSLVIKRPKGFEKLSNSLKSIGEINFTPTNNNILIYDLIKPELFEKSLELLNVYDNIFFTKSEEIAKFVYEKQLIRLIQNKDEFDNEILVLKAHQEEERKRKINQVIVQIEREIDQIDPERVQYFGNTNRLIQASRDTLSENELTLEKLQQKYDDDSKNIENSARQLNQLNIQFSTYKETLSSILERFKADPKTPEETFKQLEAYRRAFEEAKNGLKIPQINKFNYPENRPFIPEPRYSSAKDYSWTDPGSREKTVSKTSRTRPYKIALTLFILLWVGTVIYFLVFSGCDILNRLNLSFN